MDQFLNRLEICYYNMILTNLVIKKEKILNDILNLLKYQRLTTDLFNMLYISNPVVYNTFINEIGYPSLILLTYNLLAIEKSINLSKNNFIVFNNNKFYIKYKNYNNDKSDDNDKINNDDNSNNWADDKF
jgi:hypothetical protein